MNSPIKLALMRGVALSVPVLCVAITMNAISKPAAAIFGIGDIVLDPSNLVENSMSATTEVKQLANGIQGLQSFTNFRGDFMDFGKVLGFGTEFQLGTRLYSSFDDLELSFSYMQDMAEKGNISGALSQSEYVAEDFTRVSDKAGQFGESLNKSAEKFGQVSGSEDARLYTSQRVSYLETSSHTLYAESVETLKSTAKTEETAKEMLESSKSAAEGCSKPTGGTGNSDASEAACIRDLLASIDKNLVALFVQGQKQTELMAYMGHALAAQGFNDHSKAMEGTDPGEHLINAVKSRPGEDGSN